MREGGGLAVARVRLTKTSLFERSTRIGCRCRGAGAGRPIPSESGAGGVVFLFFVLFFVGSFFGWLRVGCGARQGKRDEGAPIRSGRLGG